MAFCCVEKLQEIGNRVLLPEAGVFMASACSSYWWACQESWSLPRRIGEGHHSFLVSGLAVGPINQEKDIGFSVLDDGSQDWETFVDEVSGKALNSQLVAEAQGEEVDARCKVQSLGFCAGGWVLGRDPKRGWRKPNYRSRLVIQEVRHSGIEAILQLLHLLSQCDFCFLFNVQVLIKMKVTFKNIRRAHWTYTTESVCTVAMWYLRSIVVWTVE